eukprot:1179250-Prorocentrum_minimum.AAC.1
MHNTPRHGAIQLGTAQTAQPADDAKRCDGVRRRGASHAAWHPACPAQRPARRCAAQRRVSAPPSAPAPPARGGQNHPSISRLRGETVTLKSRQRHTKESFCPSVCTCAACEGGASLHLCRAFGARRSRFILSTATTGSWVNTSSWWTPGPVPIAHFSCSLLFLCTPLSCFEFWPFPGTPMVSASWVKLGHSEGGGWRGVGWRGVGRLRLCNARGERRLHVCHTCRVRRKHARNRACASSTASSDAKDTWQKGGQYTTHYGAGLGYGPNSGITFPSLLFI